MNLHSQKELLESLPISLSLSSKRNLEKSYIGLCQKPLSTFTPTWQQYLPLFLFSIGSLILSKLIPCSSLLFSMPQLSKLLQNPKKRTHKKDSHVSHTSLRLIPSTPTYTLTVKHTNRFPLLVNLSCLFFASLFFFSVVPSFLSPRFYLSS